MIKLPANRLIQLAFGSAAAVLLVVGGLAYRSVDVSSKSSGWVQHTREVLENLQDLQFAMEELASSIRGYSLTGDDRYLEPYRAAQLDLVKYTAIVRGLTSDNPQQQPRINILEKLAAERIQRAEVLIALRKARGGEAAAEATRTGPGLQITTDYLALIGQMEDAERRLLAQRNADTARSVNATKIILILGTILGLSITAAAGWIVQRGNELREIAERGLRESERKYRMLVQGVKDYAILMLGPGGEISQLRSGRGTHDGMHIRRSRRTKLFSLLSGRRYRAG